MTALQHAGPDGQHHLQVLCDSLGAKENSFGCDHFGGPLCECFETDWQQHFYLMAGKNMQRQKL